MTRLSAAVDGFIMERNNTRQRQKNALLLDLIKILSVEHPEILLKHQDIINHMKLDIEKRNNINENKK